MSRACHRRRKWSCLRVERGPDERPDDRFTANLGSAFGGKIAQRVDILQGLRHVRGVVRASFLAYGMGSRRDQKDSALLLERDTVG